MYSFMKPAATPTSNAFTDAASTVTNTSPGPATGSATSITAAGTSNDSIASAFIGPPLLGCQEPTEAPAVFLPYGVATGRRPSRSDRVFRPSPPWVRRRSMGEEWKGGSAMGTKETDLLEQIGKAEESFTVRRVFGEPFEND